MAPIVRTRRVVAVVLLCAATVGAAAWQAPDESDGARVAEVFAAWDGERAPGCACGVVRDGQLTFARGFGVGDLVGHVPIGPDTRFYVGSIAKQFTAALVLLLADEGRIGLDEDVRTLVPELETSVTPRQLLTHTSGVRDYLQLMWLGGADTARASLDDVYRTIFRQRGLNFPPGERASYSNSGYALLSLMIRRVTGSSLREVARQRLFEPLGMHDTTFISDADGIALSVPGHRRLSGGEFEVYQPDLVVPGVGGLVTSVSDLARWARNLQQPTVGGAELVEALTRRGVLNDGAESEQAAGLEVRDRFGYEMVEHGGSNRGFSSHFAWVPGMQLASITLCNVRQARATTLNLDVVARLLAVSPPPPSRPTLSDSRLEQLEPFAGLYESPGVAGALEIEIDRPYAVATIYGDDPGGSTAASRLLGPNGDDLTLLVHEAPVHTSLAFRRLDDGRVATLQMERKPSITYRLVDPATFTELQSLAGRYRSDELAAEYRLAVEDEALVVRAVPDDGAPVDMGELLRLTDVFFVLRQDLLVNLRVLRRIDGRVEAIEINEPRLRGIPLNRVGVPLPPEMHLELQRSARHAGQ